MPPRRNRRVSDADRRRIVQCYKNGKDFLTLAQTLGVNRCTAYSIITNYVRTGNIEARRGDRVALIDTEVRHLVVMLL